MNKIKIILLSYTLLFQSLVTPGLQEAFAQHHDEDVYQEFLDEDSPNDSDEFGGFFEDPSLLGQDDSIFDSDVPEDQADEQALAEQYMLEMMEMQSSLCRETNGRYKLGDVDNPLGNEPIDCSAFTLLQYQLIEEEHSSDMAFRCISKGRRPVDAMALLKDLQIPLEKHFNCPGKKESWNSCVDDLICNTLKSSPYGLARKALEYAGVRAMKCQNSTDSDCLTEAFWGIWKNLVTNVEAAWGLLKLGWGGVKWTGGKVVDGVSWVGNKLCFWCESQDIEDHAEMSQHMIAQQKDSFFGKFAKAPIKTTKELIGKLLSSFKRYIGEAIGNNFGCAKWSSSRFNPLNGEEAVCEDPVISWDCASCGQKMNMACGVIGFVGGEILTAFIAGKTLAYGAKMSQFTKANIVAVKVSKTRAAKGITSAFKFLGTKVVGGFSFGSRIGAGLVKSGGKWAIKMGGRLVPLSAKSKARLLKILAGTGKYGRVPFRAVGKGAKKYFELMENAFVLGYQGRHGLKALRASRQITAIEKQLNTLKANLGPGDDAARLIIREQEAALTALKEYRVALKEAIAAKGDKKSLISRMKDKLTEYWRRKSAADKHSLALRATSKSNELARFTPSIMEKAEEMVLIREGVTKKFVRGTATKRELRKMFTANRERLWEAGNIAGRSLTKKEKLAILRAHYTGTRKANGFYSVADIRAKTKILKDAGLDEVSRGLMHANVTGSNLGLTPVLSNTEAAFILSRAGETGTNALILQKTGTLLQEDKVHYIGNGVFQFNDNDGAPALILDSKKDADLIAKLDGKNVRETRSDSGVTFDSVLNKHRKENLGSIADGHQDEVIPYLEAIEPQTRKVMDNPLTGRLKTTCGRLSKPMRTWKKTNLPLATIKPSSFHFHENMPDQETLSKHTTKGEYMGLSSVMSPDSSTDPTGEVRNVALCLSEGALVCMIGGKDNELVIMDKNWSRCQ